MLKNSEKKKKKKFLVERIVGQSELTWFALQQIATSSLNLVLKRKRQNNDIDYNQGVNEAAKSS